MVRIPGTPGTPGSSGQQLRPVQTPPHCLQEGGSTQTPALAGQEPGPQSSPESHPLPGLLTQLAFLCLTFSPLLFMW